MLTCKKFISLITLKINIILLLLCVLILQQVRIEDKNKSRSINVSSGIPQGFHCVPLLISLIIDCKIVIYDIK